MLGSVEDIHSESSSVDDYEVHLFQKIYHACMYIPLIFSSILSTVSCMNEHYFAISIIAMHAQYVTYMLEQFTQGMQS